MQKILTVKRSLAYIGFLLIAFSLTALFLKTCLNKKKAVSENLPSLDIFSNTQINSDSNVLMDKITNLRCSYPEVGLAENVLYKVSIGETITKDLFCDIKKVLKFCINFANVDDLLFEASYFGDLQRSIVLGLVKNYTDESVLEYIYIEYYGLKESLPELTDKQIRLSMLKSLEKFEFIRREPNVKVLSETVLNMKLEVQWRINNGFLDSKDFKTIFRECKIRGKFYWLPIDHNLTAIE